MMNKSHAPSLASWMSLLVLFWCPPCSAALTYRNDQLKYSISLPEGWMEIPQAVLNQTINKRSQPSSSAKGAQFVAGFQKNSSRWFAHPYLLIQNYPSTSLYFETSLEKLAEEVKGVGGIEKTSAKYKKARYDKPIVDRNRNLVYYTMEDELPDGVKVKSLSVFFPGRTGIVSLFFNSRLDGYDDNSADFQAVINSVSFDPAARYAKGNPGSSRRKNVWETTAVVLIGLLALTRFRRKGEGPYTGDRAG